jgi:hypothetical protein
MPCSRVVVMTARTSFREAGAAVADAGKEEVVPDAPVVTDAAAHLVDVGARPLAEVRDLVHERDARREERVGGVLRHLGAGVVHRDDGVPGAHERLVQLAHDLERLLAHRADDDAVGLHEVVDGRAFLQELGVGDDVELVLRERRHDRV